MKLQKSTARDVFLYLLMIVTLYIGVVSFIGVIWQYVNYLLPDALQYYRSGILDMIRGFISALIVTWPIYLWMSYIIEKDIKEDPTKHQIWVRRWLLYLTLFVAAITMIIDLIILINNFLDGELTLKFALKTLTVLVVAAAVFGYYLWQLKHEEHSSKLPRNLAIATSVVIVITIISGFFLIGSPAKQRSIRLDEERVQDLQQIQSNILSYWQQKDSLPQSLTDLQDDFFFSDMPVDPETQEEYNYNVTGDLTFSLCANFADENLDQSTSIARQYAIEGDWDHAAGTVCFERTIDPELHSTDEKLPVIR